jgi:uncharacterized BrkB/YihY/UPF0761 family membrane protein
MAKPSKWTWLWIAWLAAFLGIEIAAAVSKHKKPRTLSEHLWAWFPRGWRRALIVGLLSLLAWHIASGPDIKPVYYEEFVP